MQSMTYLLLPLLCLPLTAADNCFFCASPDLEENWQLTNFAVRPEGIKYTESCSTGTETALKKPCASGVCYEALIPFNNKVNYLRGCYADFLNTATNYTSSVVAAKPVCNYGAYGTGVTVTDEKKNNAPPSQATTASRWCVNGAAGTMCNNALVYSDNLYTDSTGYFTGKGCVEGTAHNCINCSHFGGAGDCSAATTTTCRAPYCVKYEGYLNGDAVVVRACAPSMPFSGDQCVRIDTTSDFALAGVTLKLPYGADHCYCTGENCNPSSMVSSSLLLSLLLPLLSRFLPFGCSS
ncbi:hypothetical protein PFISCL1PPCAC_8081 [Pristionchus fissidentatus]|uniref:Uncharacterized protein n=1 Tax=Pristionchus fissidentatus TaxID=1538716 RepID=A0AAV5VEA7_9BILA|nr:hypothetical protein PFISCL1PPCAC_8081 [Pristionchus fissidentatus]